MPLQVELVNERRLLLSAGWSLHYDTDEDDLIIDGSQALTGVAPDGTQVVIPWVAIAYCSQPPLPVSAVAVRRTETLGIAAFVAGVGASSA